MMDLHDDRGAAEPVAAVVVEGSMVNSGAWNNQPLLSLLAEARSLRTEAVEKVVDFYAKIFAIEMDERSWKGDPDAGTGYVTFEQLLKRENMTDIARYSRFKAAIVRFGMGRVRAIGLEAIVLLLAVPDTVASLVDPSVTAVSGAIHDALMSRERNGVPPSSWNMGSIVRKHAGPKPKKIEPNILATDRLMQLEAENAKLRRENARLKKKLSAAEAKLSRAPALRSGRGTRSRGK